MEDPPAEAGGSGEAASSSGKSLGNSSLILCPHIYISRHGGSNILSIEYWFYSILSANHNYRSIYTKLDM